MAAIETEGLTRRFGDVVAVDELSLRVETGEVYGFLGPNGAGKSTTISMLLGFLAPSEGTARVLDRDVTTASRAIRERIGLLPEGYGLYENLTGREHLVSAIETKAAVDDPDELLARVGLAPEDARRAAGEYSTGMRQRLCLAVALVGDPELIVLDEPSAGLDPNGVKLLRRLVREEAERGATVFFSSHVLDEVERVCDRVGIMRDGSLAAVNAPEELREQLGAGSTVRVTAASPIDAANGTRESALAAVGGIEDVREVSVDGSTVAVDCASPAAKMPVLRRLDDAVEIVDVAVEDASLETVFEEFAGPGASGGTDGADPAAGTGAGVAASAERDGAAATGTADDGESEPIPAGTGGGGE